ncbi:hypothetical protein SAMN02745673_02462 [Marinactinospora thermotolerans DSM 45154]|uniref:MinD-like ATPase involved in chromosome partitioning or flagellar assembly n=1 Tax=Marinactinospora thermotolerans DSM 45154 TaxID=1122192 RepID=A0A1T4R3X2_9ACTN|nr:hypothetical protein [Marinactinospora thermotolerans]SKA10338.1 hypothetical protein SAMN02745673_02462 [Marinactinospora thermotolerans DSM 45154]
MDEPHARGAVAAPVTGPHGDSLMRRIGRAVARSLWPADDLGEAVETGRAVQRPITTGRRIAVGGVDGETDHGVLTALLATVFAHYRHDRVLAVDVDPGVGSLEYRFGVRPRLSLGDLGREAGGGGSFEVIEPYLTAVRERLWTLPVTRDDMGGHAAGDRGVVTALSRFFGVTLVDCGPETSSAVDRAVLAAAHARVLVVPATREGAFQAGRALDLMVAEDAGLPRRSVVVFAEQAPGGDPRFDLLGTAGVVRRSGAAIALLGYDRHLALTSVPDPRRLARNTHTTVVRLAAETLRRAG